MCGQQVCNIAECLVVFPEAEFVSEDGVAGGLPKGGSFRKSLALSPYAVRGTSVSRIVQIDHVQSWQHHIFRKLFGIHGIRIFPFLM
jgi:hypothetical protein